MAQFPRPIYVDTRSNVMIGGKSSEQTEADLAAGVVTVRPTHLPDPDAKGDGVHLI